ncbi:hypothetical protein BCR32DRAFT_234457 [Anaeromyces robustus]|uniref:EamA domain-containing protein n=1 Tax=Anaeromyces robustus TaxID=1754192 RepID=A0A1Y1X151_9FUNG|nr:hypothetical protein BCR32DRAFT_234457 [Anaeromyces robustus]|eukprot:ORX79146.1 hypothetical protein BCR32DRAFT_234457 [Anaeromyces robustus]
MEDDSNISNKTTIDSYSGKSITIYLESSESESISIDDENASLLRHNTNINPLIKKEHSENYGLILMALSALAFSIMSLCVRVENKKYPFFQTVFARSIFQIFGSYIGCKIIRINPWGQPEHYFLLLCRGACSAIGIILYFSGLSHLPLVDNTVIYFTGPAVTSLIAWFILDDRLTTLNGFLSVFSLFGVVLISEPQLLFQGDDNSSNPCSVYFLLPLFGACMGSFAYIIIRYIGMGIHYLVHIFYFGIASTIISFFALFIFHVQDPIMPESTTDWLIHIVIGVSAFVSQCLFNRGLQFCSTGPGTMMGNLNIVFAYIFGIIILGEIPKWNSIIGTLIIICSSIGMGIKYFIKKEKEPTNIAVAISIDEEYDDNLSDTNL